MRSSLSKLGRVHGALAERGIEDKLIESCLGGEIVQRTAAQIGWVRNLVVLRDYMVTFAAFVAIEKNCKEQGI